MRLPLGFGSGFCAIVQVVGERADAQTAQGNARNARNTGNTHSQMTEKDAQNTLSSVFRIRWEEVPHVWWVGPSFIIGFVGLIAGFFFGVLKTVLKAFRPKRVRGRHAAFLILLFVLMPVLLSACSAAYWPKLMSGSDVRSAAPVVAEVPKSPLRCSI